MSAALGRAALAAILGTVGSVTPTLACSLVEGAALPTNYELVRAADAIVLAHAEPLPGSRERLRFVVDETLAGSFPEKTLTLPAYGDFAGASEPDDFARARPGAYSGGCIAADYRLGGSYVLLLADGPAGWDLERVAFARVNEEVPSAHAPWVEAVRAYAAIARLGDYEREKAALRALARRGLPGVAADVERHFRTPTAAKSEADLLALQATPRDSATRRQALWALAEHDGAATAALFHGVLAGPRLDESAAGPACHWAERRQVAGELANVLRHARHHRAGQHWACLAAVATLASASDETMVAPLVAELDDDELAAFYGAAAALARRDPAARELRRRVGEAPREHAPLALLLAAWGDPAILRWAAGPGQAPGHDRWVAAYVVARTPLAEGDAARRALLERRDAELTAALIDGLAEAARPDRLERVAEALATLPDDEQVTNAAQRALGRLARDGEAGAGALLATLPAETAAAH